MPQKWVIAPYGDPTNEPPWGSTLKIETGAKNIMPTPHSASVEGQFRQISIVPKTLSLILDDIFRSYGMCLQNRWLIFMHDFLFMAI